LLGHANLPSEFKYLRAIPSLAFWRTFASGREAPMTCE
jgi:hypothetical protein